jgi:hypothetical protein
MPYMGVTNNLIRCVHEDPTETTGAVFMTI